uniref:Uncharacterized protein n=1 Tax=uncultured Thiotrichaceae bacterium TaxID=298394 RepID=A0A6S6U2C6_9GAMM|nr:MAG: Unknown protein [uncultured Thiotrichaceae bacterium]
MSSEPVNLDWLKTGDLKSVVAQRFAEFCANDLKTNTFSDDSDSDLYKEAVQLVIQRIESSAPGDQ